MQSPLVFDPKNAHSYSSLMPFMSDDAKNNLPQGHMPVGMNGGLLTPGKPTLCAHSHSRKGALASGLLSAEGRRRSAFTRSLPILRADLTEIGPSGDMFPQFRMDGPQMSPMTLEMLARNEGMDPSSGDVSPSATC